MKLGLFVLLIYCAGCTTGHCVKTNTQLSEHLQLSKKDLTTPKKERAPESTHVLIYKFDGSKQCKQGKVISLKNMERELKGIDVFSSKKKNDGLMHLSVCGGETGNANVYEIAKKDLAKAKKRGFKIWRF